MIIGLEKLAWGLGYSPHYVIFLSGYFLALSPDVLIYNQYDMMKGKGLPLCKSILQQYLF